jgi:GNAT superfamily N-acetyltransferase
MFRKGSFVFRSPVHVREATPDDGHALVEVWAPEDRTPDDDVRAHLDAAASLARIAADPDQRLLVGVLDGEVAGAVHLARSPLTPIHAESAIYVLHLHVLEEYRRHGVGHALLEATVSWAEEKDSSHVVAAVTASSRDSNRFMARLGLAQVATVRGATVAVLRAKLPGEAPAAAARRGARSQRAVGQVLAQRRSRRRAQEARPS